MHLLFVSQLHPWPLDNGAAHRVYRLLEGLLQRHRITLVVLAENGKVVNESFPLYHRFERVVAVPRESCAFGRTRRFEEWPSASDGLRALVTSPLPSFVQRWHSPALIDALRELRRTARFDAVWVERSYVAESVRRAGFRGHIVVDVDDVESITFRRVLAGRGRYRSKPLHYAEWLKRYLYERLLPLRYWRLVVCKEDDRRFFGRLGARSITVVPNGMTAATPVGPTEEAGGEMVYVGALGYDPNVDAVLYFMRDIFPRIRERCPAARMVIVGRDPVPSIRALHDGTACTVVSSPPDVAPYLRRASLVVVPLRLGSGTRIKVLEALGHGKAVVSTSVGAEGLDLRPGSEIEIADEPGAFADACVRLLSDPAARRRMGLSGHARVLERYDWRGIVERADAVLHG